MLKSVRRSEPLGYLRIRDERDVYILDLRVRQWERYSGHWGHWERVRECDLPEEVRLCARLEAE